MGPTTFAVDSAGRVWLYDIAKARLVGYDRGVFARSVAFGDSTQAALLVVGTTAYLMQTDDRGAMVREVAIDLSTGARVGETVAARGDNPVYPRERRPWSSLPDGSKGVAELIGHDSMGTTYDRESRLQVNGGEPAGSVRRSDLSGRVTAVGFFALGTARPRDYFIADDGTLFQLEWLEGPGGVPQRVVVTRVLDPR